MPEPMVGWWEAWCLFIFRLPGINQFEQKSIPGSVQMASKWLDFSTAKAFLVTFWTQKVTKQG
jgi:hypothetical protein